MRSPSDLTWHEEANRRRDTMRASAPAKGAAGWGGKGAPLSGGGAWGALYTPVCLNRSGTGTRCNFNINNVLESSYKGVEGRL